MKPRSLGESAVRVLAALGSGSRYGFDVMDRTGLRSGTVYRALGRLEELGLVASRWETPARAVREKRPRRRYYQLTGAGRAELRAARERYAAFADALTSER